MEVLLVFTILEANSMFKQLHQGLARELAFEIDKSNSSSFLLS